jgi:hypothetical protein
MAHQHGKLLDRITKIHSWSGAITISFFLLKLPSGIAEQETNKEIKIN